VEKHREEAMWRRLITQKYFCGFDLGELTVKAALIKGNDNQAPELLGVYESKTIGFNNGSLTDIAELSECVHTTISGLLGKTNIKLKDIQLGIAGNLIDKRYSNAVIPLLEKGNKVISPRDLRKVQDQAKILGAHMEEYVLHNFPQYYKVDDINTALNPLGLYGRKLEVHTLLVMVKNLLLQNLIKSVNQAGFDVANVFYTSYSSAEASLSEYHRRQGCALVDIGSMFTDVLIFKDGFLKYVVNVPLGGEHLTQSIANRLNIHVDLAEEIKRSYAFALSSDARSDEEILIKNEEGYIPVKKEVIAQALESTVSRFVELVIGAIKNSGLLEQINAGVVLTGGGSLLPGLEERIEQGAKLQVKAAKITITSKRVTHAAKYCAAVGLAQCGLAKAMGAASTQQGTMTFQQKAYNKMTELYQEYF